MEGFKKEMTDLFPTRRGQILYFISQGRDLSKLDVKTETGISISTVISSVDSLYKDDLLTVYEEKKKEGGKPRSVINVNEKKTVCGVSYKAGVLSAVLLNLKGEIQKEEAIEILDKSAPASSYVLSLLKEILKGEKPPLAIGLAMNAVGLDSLCEEIRKNHSFPIYLTTNSGAAAYYALFSEKEFPVCALGVGNRIKCACTDGALRLADVSDLLSPVFSGRTQTYGSVLSAAAVESALREKRYEGTFYFDEGKLSEAQDVRSYSEALTKALSSLVNDVFTFLSPRKLYLFGDYITEGFFERVKRSAGRGEALVRFSPSRLTFAVGAAYYAMKECVFI